MHNSKIKNWLKIRPQTLILGFVFSIHTHSFAQNSNQKQIIKPMQKLSVQSEETKDMSMIDLREQITAIDSILATPLSVEKKSDLQFRQSVFQLQLSQKLSEKRKSIKEITPEEQDLLNSALKGLSSLESSFKQDNIKQAQVHYFKGIAYYQLEKFSDMKVELEKSLKISTELKQSSNVSLMVAEQYYEEQKFADALKYYKLLIDKRENEPKALSYYKMAWCLVKLKNNKEAIDSFLKAIENSKSEDFQESAKRDLALFLVQNLNDEKIISFAKEQFKNSESYIHFMYHVLSFRKQTQPNSNVSLVLESILELQKSFDERLKTYSRYIQSLQSKHASLTHIQAVELVEKDFKSKKNNQISQDSVTINELRLGFETELRLFIDTYLNKIENIEKLSKKQIVQSALKIIDVYHLIFANSPKDYSILALQVDLCSEMQNEKCLSDLSKWIGQRKLKLKDANYVQMLEDLQKKIDLELFGWLEKKYQKDKTQYFSAYTQSLQKLQQTYQEPVLNLKLIKKLSAAYFEFKNWAAASPYLEQIYKKETNENNLYSYWFALLKQNKCPFIIEHDSEATTERLKDIVRDCSLQLAEASGQKGDLEEYKNHITRFLKTNPESLRQAQVYADWFRRLEKAGLDHEIGPLFNSLKPEIKKSKYLAGFQTHIMLESLERGDFAEMLSFTSESLDPDVVYLQSIAGLSQTKIEERKSLQDLNDSLNKMSFEKRTYILDSFLLSSPSEYLKYRGLPTPLKTTDAQKIFLAISLEQKLNFPKLTQEQMIALRNILPDSYKTGGSSNLEKELKKINFSGLTKDSAKLAVAIKALKKTRVGVSQEISNLSVDQQRRILNLARDLELTCADTILKSELPAGITSEDQKRQYLDGLKKLAKDHKNQAQEYENSKLQLKEEGLAGSVKTPQKLNMSLFEWPKGEYADKAREIARTNVFGALVYLDHMFNEKKLNAPDYWTLRSGILIDSRNCEPMLRYVREEVHAGHQDKLLIKWGL